MTRGGIRPLSEAPLVSVIMTSYNYEKFVSQAIASVFAQTYRRLELIIVDDGSVDGSIGVIHSAIQHAPVPSELIVQENAGQAAALNAGFQRARGEAVCFIDSDDRWTPDKIAATLDFMREHPGGGLYQHQLGNDRGDQKKPHLASGDILSKWIAAGTVDVLKQKDLVGIFLPTTGLTMHKQVLDRVFPIPRQLVVSPDGFLTRASCCHGPLYSDSRVLGFWRDHGANMGKTIYSFDNYWVPTVMPAINEYFRRAEIPVQFVFRS